MFFFGQQSTGKDGNTMSGHFLPKYCLVSNLVRTKPLFVKLWFLICGFGSVKNKINLVQSLIKKKMM
jgi:hypothetical protein